MTAGADPFANPECQGDDWVVLQGSIVIEEALWFECLWIWV